MFTAGRQARGGGGGVPPVVSSRGPQSSPG